MTKLKNKRLAVGITQDQLAEKAHLNVRTLQHYEQGSKNIDGAKVETLLNLSTVLNCKISDIIESDVLQNKLKTKGY